MDRPKDPTDKPAADRRDDRAKKPTEKAEPRGKDPTAVSDSATKAETERKRQGR